MCVLAVNMLDPGQAMVKQGVVTLIQLDVIRSESRVVNGSGCLSSHLLQTPCFDGFGLHLWGMAACAVFWFENKAHLVNVSGLC